MGKGYKNRLQHCGVLGVASVIAQPYLRLHGTATTAMPCKDTCNFISPLQKKKYLFVHIILCRQHTLVGAGACKGSRLPEDGTEGGCELFDLGAGNGTQGLCKRNVCS